jgi:hypothetical protein
LSELRADTNSARFAVLRPRTFALGFGLLGGTPDVLDAHGVLAMLLCLPLNYALELGFFAAVAFYKYKKLRSRGCGEMDRILLFLLASGVLVGSFLASGTLLHNDLGWRAMLVVQFVLLLWAMEWAQEVLLPALSVPGARLSKGAWFIVFLGLIGFAGTVYDAVLLRFNAVAIDHGRSVAGSQELAAGLGSRTAELREIYTHALKDLPASALVQEDPLVSDAVQQGLYSSWGAAARGRDYGPSYGGDPAVYSRTEELLGPVFGPEGNLAYVADVCAKTRIGAYVVQDFDPVWRNQGSWIWSITPVYSGEHARAFTCADVLRSTSRGLPAKAGVVN